MNFWAVFLSGGFGAAIVSGAVVIIRLALKLWANKPLVAVTVADKLNDLGLELVRAAEASARLASADAKSARDEARVARDDAEQARRDAREARQEATEARREAMDANREFRRLKTAIMSPYATLDKLRELVGEPGPNGAGNVVAQR